MKLRIISFFILTIVGSLSTGQVQESTRIVCEYSSIRLASFNQGTARDDAAIVVNQTVKMLAALLMREDPRKYADRKVLEEDICKSEYYMNARRLHDRIAKPDPNPAKVKYLSTESYL